MADDQNNWLDWNTLVKQTVARFARGNIAAQKGRIQFPEEQERERVRLAPTMRKWKQRAMRAAGR
jgi:hypothetical protein